MMKKLLIVAVAIIFLFSMAACGQQNGESQTMRSIIAGKTFTYEKEGCGGSFNIHIKDDGTFTYYEGYLSSHFGMGNWALDDDVLVLSDNETMMYSFVNRFRVTEDALVFISKKSSNFLYVKVADGERFINTNDDAK